LDDGILASVIWLFLLIVLHALLILAFMALKNIRQTSVREQAASGSAAARRILNLTADFSRLQLTSQLALTLIRFAIAAVATIGLAEPFERSSSINPLLGYLAVLLPTALLTIILGDLVPSAIASGRADQLAPIAAYPMRWLVVLLTPLGLFMMGLSRLFSTTFGGEHITETITEEEIMTLVDAGEKAGTIEDEEKEMIYSVLQFGETLAREVMVPRIDVVALDITTPLKEALDTFIESGHSRIPVYEDTIDNIKGLLYAKDILPVLQNGDHKSIGDLIRPAYFVPETKRADVLLAEMKARKIHMALVVDEYGGTAGMVTIEDLIEEIVGDIRDEYDIYEKAEYEQTGPDEFSVDASMNIDDFNELMGTHLPSEDTDTVGGYIYSYFGRVPAVGETVERRHVTLRVEEVEGQRIRRVHVTRKHDVAPAGDETAPGGQTPEPEQVTD